MAREGKYGEIFATNKTFHKDEPVFLLRGTDPLAFTTIMLYHALARVAGCSQGFLDEILTHAGNMETWQHENTHLVKTRPD